MTDMHKSRLMNHGVKSGLTRWEDKVTFKENSHASVTCGES
jgi:hypothetical protein